MPADRELWGKVIAMGLFVAMNWLIVAFIDRLQRWKPPWGQTEERPSMNRIGKVMMIGFASVLSLVFLIMLLTAIAG